MTEVGFPACAEGLFLLATAPGPALEPTQPPIQWVPGGSGPETDHYVDLYLYSAVCLHRVVLS